MDEKILNDFNLSLSNDAVFKHYYSVASNLSVLVSLILGEEVLVDNDSLGAMHLMVRHEKSRNRDGNTAVSCGGEGGDM